MKEKKKSLLRAPFFQAEAQAVPKFGRSVGDKALTPKRVLLLYFGQHLESGVDTEWKIGRGHTYTTTKSMVAIVAIVEL